MAFALFQLGALAAATSRYGIVFDAGSSGSRIHVYTWRTGGGGAKNDFDLVSDDLLKIKPGLSAFKEKTSEAGASLKPLLEFAKQKIPADRWASTPAFLMATAGLRMVGESAKDAILKSVCTELSSSGLTFSCEWATLLDGLEEGLYGWVTVNYLLETLYPPPVKESVGIIDLGGGSVQIVFPTPQKGPEEYMKHLDFSGRKHDLYIKSHLGFGLDAARTALLDLLLSKFPNGTPSISNPCLPSGATTVYKQTTFTGEGNWARCLKAQSHLFSKKNCPFDSCSFGGAYQPNLPRTFYGFSYLFDRTAAIGLLDGKMTQYGTQRMTVAQIAEAGTALCALEPAAVMARFSQHQDASKSNNFCGDVAYLVALLSALGFSDTSQLTMSNKIQDVELVWTLGAMLAKSAELSASSMSFFSSLGGRIVMLISAVIALYFLSRYLNRSSGHAPYSRVQQLGHESGATHK